MRRRIALLLAALVVALGGTTLVFLYFNGRAASAAAEQEPQVAVLQATAVIPAGTTTEQALEQGLVALTELPARVVPAGALLDLTPLAGHVAEATLQPGELVLQGKFVQPAAATRVPIPDDKMAVSVEVAAEALRVAGFVEPGAEVAVFTTYPVVAPPLGARPEGVEPLPSGAAEPAVASATRMLLERALVIAVGDTTTRSAPADGGVLEGQQVPAPAPAVVTFAVSVDEAQRLAHAAQTGTITLGLLTDQSRTGPTAPDDNRTIFD